MLFSYPLSGGPCWNKVWYGKTRMVRLPDGEKILKIYLFVLTWSRTWRTDGQTHRHHMTA